MTWPSSFSGKSYVAIWDAMRAAATKEKPQVLVEEPAMIAELGDAYVPEMTNAQAIALVTAWDHAGGRGNVPDDDWAAWRRWSLRLQQWALGWRETGDKFVMTAANAAAPYAGQLGALWASTLALARSLDANHATVRALPFAASYAAYEASARESWRIMQDLAARDQTCSSCLPAPYETDVAACADCAEKVPRPGPLPAPPSTPKPEPRTGGSGGALLLLLVAAVLVGRKSR